MSETVQYQIYCQSCGSELDATWSPKEGTIPTEEQIQRSTRTGYLCQQCATPQAPE